MEEAKRLKAYLELLIEHAKETKQKIYVPVEVAELVIKDIDELEEVFKNVIDIRGTVILD